VVIAASQKGLGCPPGLSVTCASQKALKVLENRKTPVTSYFASWKVRPACWAHVSIDEFGQRWLPIHEAYDKGAAAYFGTTQAFRLIQLTVSAATPPVQLVSALAASLKQITNGSVSIEDRFRLHKEASKKLKQAITDLGLKQVPLDANSAANGMTVRSSFVRRKSS
jgi:alanine-glyoxylate transaminase/serine-glyoxylate transaminase/serine-pyruvate transaminase